ncbi:MAG: helix-turn-helix domain-containing protein [Actinomycetota bacterium]|nr:helix-turn-helix domain-containing protein [Actinomycetota bacterium]
MTVGGQDDVREPPPFGPAPSGVEGRRWSRRPADDAEARALASGLRLRILRLTLDEPLSNKEIAQRLDRNAATVLHHVRTLVATGFLAAQPERRGSRNAREVPYLATRKSWYLDTPPAGDSMLSAFLEEVAAVPVEEVRASRLGLRLSVERREELDLRLSDLLSEYAERDPDPDGDPWAAYVVLYPDPGRR